MPTLRPQVEIWTRCSSPPPRSQAPQLSGCNTVHLSISARSGPSMEPAVLDGCCEVESLPYTQCPRRDSLGNASIHLLLSVRCSKPLSTPSRQLQVVSTAQQAPPFDRDGQGHNPPGDVARQACNVRTRPTFPTMTDAKHTSMPHKEASPSLHSPRYPSLSLSRGRFQGRPLFLDC